MLSCLWVHIHTYELKIYHAFESIYTHTNSSVYLYESKYPSCSASSHPMICGVHSSVLHSLSPYCLPRLWRHKACLFQFKIWFLKNLPRKRVKLSLTLVFSILQPPPRVSYTARFPPLAPASLTRRWKRQWRAFPRRALSPTLHSDLLHHTLLSTRLLEPPPSSRRPGWISWWWPRRLSLLGSHGGDFLRSTRRACSWPRQKLTRVTDSLGEMADLGWGD
jgi:hypothetical protein